MRIFEVKCPTSRTGDEENETLAMLDMKDEASYRIIATRKTVRDCKTESVWKSCLA